ncbi:hypothetical protein BASA50_004922 [Batrachochytrium salamandrivorans]|uniref:Large ribosomal subunit protein bL21m n=1 Tax=Batrachochytrium salamandrivorans TaxID=1357716 RepID=A0ABQ8FHB0_9FUNG|nr:hypothetical protein BASA61_006856 [Batrachochytrium salamandrivorans]KAH6596776.1 hypothetical protein BASA50_004922 [Batrachochytrium salamandrivorans]KAH9267147.1 hypothetical protein BASA83_010175 [Batrachochytrium salamandrivorans]
MFAIRRPLLLIDQVQQTGLLTCQSLTGFTCTRALFGSPPSLIKAYTTRSSPNIAVTSISKAITERTSKVADNTPLKASSADTNKALSLMFNQSKYYAVVEIKNRPYHVAKNDVVVVPRMNDLKIGDVISLDRVREIGSPDYVLQGNPYLHPSYYTIQASAIEHTIGKVVHRKHTKRSGVSKTVHMTSSYTILRICEIDITNPQ